MIEGTRTETVENAAGQVIEESVYDISSNILVSYSLVPSGYVDFAGRPTRMEFMDGTYWTRSYGCCGLESETDREGITTTYTYDSLARLDTTTRNGITFEEVRGYDSDDSDGIVGVTLTRTREGTDSSVKTLSVETYDLAGQLIASKDAVGNVTTFDEAILMSGNVERTTTYEDSATVVETSHPSGDLIEVSGSAAYPKEYDSGTASDTHDGLSFNATWTREIFLGPQDETDEYVTTYRDMLGRVYKVVYPTPDGTGTATEYRYYNSKGQLEKTVDADGVTNLYVYNDLGDLEDQVLDMDQDGVVDYNETDRISRTETEVVNDSVRGDVRRTTTTVWTTDGTGDTEAVTVVDQAVDGLDTWQTVYGQTTHSQVSYDGQGGRTETVTTPEGVSTVSTYSDGRLSSRVTTNPAGETISSLSYTYDAHGRVSTSTDARNGATTFTYYDDDQVHTVTAPSHDGVAASQVTTYVYDERGREKTVTLPDSGEVESRYFGTGDLKKQWGDRTYPVEYTYDTQGRLQTMTTWKDFNESTGSGTSGSAVTRWEYNDRGLLEQKFYNYVDSSNNDPGPSYTYTDAGRLDTRTWARSLTTTYDYNNAGDLNSIDYSDSTPDVTTTFDRRGRQKTITDASGTRTLEYNDGITVTETYTTSSNAELQGKVVTRNLDSYNRMSEVTVTESTTTHFQANFGYLHPDSDLETGRLSTVESQGITTAYRYGANSNLIDTVTQEDAFNALVTHTRVYDKLNRLESLTADPLLADTVSYTYTYNTANQRTKAELESGEYWDYAYDDLGQVTDGTKTLSGGTAIPGLDFDYAFDEIGNRDTASSKLSPANDGTYTTNTLNQYTQRTVPRLIDILVSADSSATVTVNTDSTTATGGYFLKTYDYSGEANPDDPRYESFDIQATLSGGEAAEEAGDVFLPANPEAFTYDDDGNMLTDGQWNYTWNGENRLIAMETASTAYSTGVDRQKLEFIYDSQGRRIQKQVYSWNSSTSSWDLESESLFIYDGWNLIWEFTTDGAESTEKTYTWGLDLSGSLQGAGGVGGLLQIQVTPDGSSTKSYFPACDGNGNVVSLFDETGSLTGSYEYGPFGEPIGFMDEYDLNPFRFSTKYWDSETDLAYYGFRYYSPDLGRWPNRDPLGEAGGLNLYGFVGNDGVNQWDYLGFWKISRKNTEDFAIATAESGDTIAGLAQAIGLNESDAQSWLKAADGNSVIGEIKTGCDYKIPNTIVLLKGDLSTPSGFLGINSMFTYAFGFDRSIEAKANNAIKKYKNEKLGFKIVEYNQLNRNSFLAKISEDYVSGFAIFSHGLYAPRKGIFGINKMGPAQGAAIINEFGSQDLLASFDVERAQNFDFSEVVLWVCGAGCDADWRNTVSSNGILRAAERSINANTPVNKIPIID